MLLTTVSLVPMAVALALALGLFLAWTVYLIHADRQRVVAGPVTAPLAAPVPVVANPVVAVVPSVRHVASRPHYLVAAPDPVPPAASDATSDDEPELSPVVRSGSFCTVVGASGVNANGTEMVCSSEYGSRPRWRRVARELQRTA